MQINKATLWMAGLGCVSAAWIATMATAQQPRKVDEAALKNAAKNGEEWLSYGFNPGETRYSPLKQIDASNVSRLGLAWSYEVGTGGGTQESTPLVSNGVMYSVTNWSIVFAVDARTGKEKWRWDPEVNRTTVTPKICCGIVNRGLAIYDNKVFVPVIDGRLEAIDIETGKPVWETRVAYAQDDYTLTIAPRIVHGRVVLGVSGAEYPVRGFIAAYEPATGKQAWKFYTIPGDLSKPGENEAMKKAIPTWSNKHTPGGGTVWDAVAYDPDADLVYFGTGNAGPWPSDLRDSKGKDNLYVCSIIALNATTGEYKWHYQTGPGDTWDYDAVQQLVVADITIKGQPRKVIMQANKNGFFYELDRLTGKFISGQPFVKVSWAKGLDEATGRPIVNDESYYDKENSVSVMPGPNGGHNWAAMSFNPMTGLMYIPATSGVPGSYVTDPNFEYKPGQLNLGISFGAPAGGRGGRGGGGGAGRGGAAGNAAPLTGEVATAAAQAAAAPAPAAPAAPAKPVTRKPAPPSVGPDVGMGSVLVAWDPATQTPRWHVPGGGSTGGGTMTTAGNLVFQVLTTGVFEVYSADKGEKLLEVQTNLRSATGPPMTYMLDGKQYVTFQGGQGAAGSGFGGGGASPITPKLLTFVLDGKAPLPAPAAQGGQGAGGGRGR